MMGYYIRKLSRAKWPDGEELKAIAYKKVRADAITGCTRTTDNKLSLWKVDKKGVAIEDALPLIVGFEKPNRCEILYIDEKLLLDEGIDIEQELGNTPLKDLADTHFNAVVNDYEGLGKFARVMLRALNEKDNYIKIKENDVKKAVKDLVESGRLPAEKLNSKMQEKLGYKPINT